MASSAPRHWPPKDPGDFALEKLGPEYLELLELCEV